MKMNIVNCENRCERSSMMAAVALVASLLAALSAAPAQAAIVYLSQSSGSNNALPTNGTAGSLTIPAPPGVSAGRTLIASIAARPSGMQPTVTVPTGWFLMTSTDQPAGGVSTAPGGMTLLTYYKIATVSEPASYTWTFTNTTTGQGGSAVGGILMFSGVDTSAGNPIDVWSARLTPNGTTHATNSITPTVGNTMIVSSISFLSSSTFGNPTGIAGITERLDVAAPPPNAAIGTTLQMSTAPWATATATGASSAVAASDADTGVGHLMALRPSAIDLVLGIARSGPLIPGSSASYTLTVTNTGFATEPGPLTIVNTLPPASQVTFASFSGAGWSCSQSGQTITCSRNGALLSGATAPALVINVNVTAGASGTVTNTATVSGTGGDGDLSDNTVADSYTIPIQAYAYYAMDETTWGVVTDSSGNGRNGTVLGSAAPTGYPPASPPGSAIVGTPGTCGAGRIPVTANSGVDTGIDINSLGNAGSITLWYSSNTVWNDGTDRMLLDASNDIPGSDKHFYLVKGDGGEIRFGLEDDNDDNERVNSSGNSFPANQWHHIAITWDWNTSNQMRLYLDGVLVDSEPINDNIGNYATLYLGTTHSGITGTDTDFTTNTANGYLDEVRVYAVELTAAQIAADMSATHSCVAVDHFAINIGAAAASTCTAKDITITAQDASNNTVTNYTGTVNITTSSNHGDWSQSPVTGTLANGAADDGAATYTFVAGDNGVKTLQLTNHHADDLTVSVADSTLPSTARTSATINFRDNTFVITNDAIQVAGRDQAMSVAMWRRDLTTGNCAIATGYTGAKPLDAWLTLDPSHPAGATIPTIGALTLPTAAPAVNPGSNNLALTFVNGSVNFNLSTTDVGKYVLNLRDDTRSFATGVDILGSSNTITTRPFALAVSAVKSGATDNPNGANATDAVFIGAGVNFEATIGAYRYNAAADGNNDGLPDAAATLAQTIAGGLTPRFNATATLTLSAAGFTPAGGTLGTLSNATFSSFVGGTQTRTDLNYTEVGSFLFDSAVPLVTNYLGTSGVNLAGTFFTAAGSQTNATRVGRFTPAYFDITSVTPGCNSTFTYAGLMPVGPQPSVAGQAFSVTVTARNAIGVTTSNYRDFGGGNVFSKDTTISDAGTATNFTNNTLLAAGYSFGAGTDSTITYRFAAKETAPQTLTLRAVDTDNVSSAGHAELPTEIRSGRVRIINAYGSELLDLPLPMRAEYYDATSGWITNPNDGCTAVALGSLTPANPIPVIGSSPARTTNASIANPSFVAGDAGLQLSAPLAGGSGYADLTADLSPNAWLQHDWNGTGTAGNPTGRATFGLYRGSPRHIYQRQRFN